MEIALAERRKLGCWQLAPETKLSCLLLSAGGVACLEFTIGVSSWRSECLENKVGALGSLLYKTAVVSEALDSLHMRQIAIIRMSHMEECKNKIKKQVRGNVSQIECSIIWMNIWSLRETKRAARCFLLAGKGGSDRLQDCPRRCWFKD